MKFATQAGLISTIKFLIENYVVPAEWNDEDVSQSIKVLCTV